MDDAGTCARWERSSRIGTKSISATETGARTIRHALEQLILKGSVRKAGDEFIVEAEHRRNQHRRVESGVSFRLENGKTGERGSVRMDCLTTAPSKDCFDYVLKKTTNENLRSRN